MDVTEISLDAVKAAAKAAGQYVTDYWRLVMPKIVEPMTPYERAKVRALAFQVSPALIPAPVFKSTLLPRLLSNPLAKAAIPIDTLCTTFCVNRAYVGMAYAVAFERWLADPKNAHHLTSLRKIQEDKTSTFFKVVTMIMVSTGLAADQVQLGAIKRDLMDRGIATPHTIDLYLKAHLHPDAVANTDGDVFLTPEQMVERRRLVNEAKAKIRADRKAYLEAHPRARRYDPAVSRAEYNAQVNRTRNSRIDAAIAAVTTTHALAAPNNAATQVDLITPLVLAINPDLPRTPRLKPQLTTVTLYALKHMFTRPEFDPQRVPAATALLLQLALKVSTLANKLASAIEVTAPKTGFHITDRTPTALRDRHALTLILYAELLRLSPYEVSISCFVTADTLRGKFPHIATTVDAHLSRVTRQGTPIDSPDLAPTTSTTPNVTQ